MRPRHRNDQRIVAKVRPRCAPGWKIGHSIRPANANYTGFRCLPAIAATPHPVVGIGKRNASYAMLTRHDDGVQLTSSEQRAPIPHATADDQPAEGGMRLPLPVVEQFVDERTGGNSQSATNYVFFSGYQTANGAPFLDSGGHLIPVFQPCDGSTPDCTTNALYIATRGAKLDVTTDSFFINDRWTLNQNFMFNLGARYERTKSTSTGQIAPGIKTSNIVPRLGASYDPLGSRQVQVRCDVRRLCWPL